MQKPETQKRPKMAGPSQPYVRVIAADKILADFARILSLLKGAESSFFYNQLGVDLVPVEHILIDNNPETA